MNCLVLLPRAAHPGRAGDTVRGPRRRRRAPSSFGSIFSSTFSSSSSTFSSCIPPSPAADPGRCFPDPGCRGAREGWWHRRTHFWRTSSGAPVVRRVAVRTSPLTSILPTRAPHPPHPILLPRGKGDADSPTWWLQFPAGPNFGWGWEWGGEGKLVASPPHGTPNLLPPVQSSEQEEAKEEQRVGCRYIWRTELSFALLRNIFLFIFPPRFLPSKLQKLIKFLELISVEVFPSSWEWL